MKSPFDIINFVKRYRFPDGRCRFRNPEFTSFCSAFMWYLSLKEGACVIDRLPYSLVEKGFLQQTAEEIDKAFLYDEVPGSDRSRQSAKADLRDFLKTEIVGESVSAEVICDEYLLKRGHYPNKGSKACGAFGLPEDIASLIASILQIESSDKVLDFGCGDSTFLRYAGKTGCELIGVDMSLESLAISEVLMFLTGQKRSSLHCANVFDPSTKDLIADKVCCNPEWRSLSVQERDNYYPNFVSEKIGCLFQVCSREVRHAEWYYLARVLAALDGGNFKSKAVVIFPYAALTRDNSAEILTHLVKEGWLEGIIALPNRSMEFTSVRPCLMVLCNRSNVTGKVKLFDAGALTLSDERSVTKGRGWARNEIAVDKIAIGYDCCEAVVSEFRPGRIFVGADDVERRPGVIYRRFGEIADIVRSTTLHLTEDLEGGRFKYHVITPGAIANGEIDDQKPDGLKFCTEMVPSEEELREGDLLVPRMGNLARGSLAIVDRMALDGIPMVTNPNLLVVRIKPGFEDDFPIAYVKAYLESEQGLRALRAGYSGSTIPTVKKSALNEVPIPQLSRCDLSKYVRKYQQLESEIRFHRREIQALEVRLNRINSEL